jgi:hypothetical protein
MASMASSFLAPSVLSGRTRDVWLSTLTQEDHLEHTKSWEDFMFNLDVLALLGQNVDKMMSQAILAAGLKYGGAGWTSGRASRRLYELSQVALVSASWTDYLNCWLFALSLYWDLDLPLVDLQDRVAEAGFALVGLLTDPDEGAPHQQTAETMEEDENTEGECSFPWDEEVRPLPKEFGELWRRAASGRRLELRTVLQEVPKFSVLPDRAPANNIRDHSKRGSDRGLRTLQQQCLHVARMLAATADGIIQERKVLYLQTFAMQAELYFRIEAMRKEASVPGSSALESTEGCLFNKEDVQQFNEKKRITELGVRRSMDHQQGVSGPTCYPFLCLSGPENFGHWKKYGQPRRPSGWPGGKGRGKGKGFGRGKGTAHHPARSIVPELLQVRAHNPSHDGFMGDAKPRRPLAMQEGCKQRRPKRSTSWHPCQASAHAQPDSPIYEGTSMSSLVGRSRSSPACFGFNHKGSGTRLARAHAQLQAEAPGPLGRSKSKGNLDRVPVCGSSFFDSGCSFSSSKASHSLVRFVKVRQPDRSGKTSPHLRLQRIKSLAGTPPLQTGPLAPYFSIPSKRDVGGKNRSEKRLFSPGTFSKNKTLHAAAGGARKVAIRGRPLWAKHPSHAVDAFNESFGKTLESPGPSGFYLFGRHSGSLQHPPGGPESFGHSPPGFGGGVWKSTGKKASCNPPKA